MTSLSFSLSFSGNSTSVFFFFNFLGFFLSSLSQNSALFTHTHRHSVMDVYNMPKHKEEEKKSSMHNVSSQFSLYFQIILSHMSYKKIHTFQTHTQIIEYNEYRVIEITSKCVRTQSNQIQQSAIHTYIQVPTIYGCLHNLILPKRQAFCALIRKLLFTCTRTHTVIYVRYTRSMICRQLKFRLDQILTGCER